MNGSGCKKCPVRPCTTMRYRGSTCASLRFQHGLGDPKTKYDTVLTMSEEAMATALADEVVDRCFVLLALYGVHPSPADKKAMRYNLTNHYYHMLLEPANEDKSMADIQRDQAEKELLVEKLRPTADTIEKLEELYGEE